MAKMILLSAGRTIDSVSGDACECISAKLVEQVRQAGRRHGSVAVHQESDCHGNSASRAAAIHTILEALNIPVRVRLPVRFKDVDTKQSVLGTF